MEQFRGMRRSRQQLSQEKTIAVLERNTVGTLALLGDEGYPYSLPISYVYVDQKLYFHSAMSGHKIDAINSYDKASFSVIDQDQVVPEKYTSYFRSVIVFGKLRILQEEDQIRKALDLLAAKYRPGHETERAAEMESGMKRLYMIEMEIEHMTGKEAIELVNSMVGEEEK